MDNVGLQALRQLHKGLLIDESWTEWTPSGFSWIAHRLRQEVTSSHPYDEGEFELCRLTCRMDVVDDVEAESDHVRLVLASVNRFAAGSAYVFDATSHRVVAHLYSRVHADTADWRGLQLLTFASYQLAQAEAEADFLAATLNGKVAVREHPTNGRREKPDDILDCVDSVIASRGNGPSSFADAFEFQAIADIAKRSNTATLGGSAEGIAVEVPFGNTTSLILMRSDWLHPRLGSGLVIKLLLPEELAVGDIASTAAMLNRREIENDYPYQGFGAWGLVRHASGQALLGHTMFIPTVLRSQGVAVDAFYGAANRGRWANRVLNPDVDEGNAWETMLHRLGIDLPSKDESDDEEERRR